MADIIFIIITMVFFGSCFALIYFYDLLARDE